MKSNMRTFSAQHYSWKSETNFGYQSISILARCIILSKHSIIIKANTDIFPLTSASIDLNAMQP